VEFREFPVDTGITFALAAIGIAIVLLTMTRTTRFVWWIIAGILGASGVVLLIYGVCDGPTVVVSPNSAVFDNLGDLYSFDVRNERSADVYSVCVLLTIDDRDYSPKDFTFSIPQGDLKPIVANRPPSAPAGAPDLADTMELTCHDGDDRIAFLIVLAHLKPQESRNMELSLTGGVTVIEKPTPPSALMKPRVLVSAPETTVRAIMNYQTMALPVNVSANSSRYCVRFPKFKPPRNLFDCGSPQYFKITNTLAHK
jgi:hypothetical protein